MIVGVSKNVGFRVKSCSPSASDIQHFFFFVVGSEPTQPRNSLESRLSHLHTRT